MRINILALTPKAIELCLAPAGTLLLSYYWLRIRADWYGAAYFLAGMLSDVFQSIL